MPQYRLHADCYVPVDGKSSVQKAGTVIEYDGPPGSQMEPLDDAGFAAHHALRAQRDAAGLPPIERYPFRLIEAKATGAALRPPMDMTIPEHWRDLKGLALTNLAKRLGAPYGVNARNARTFIEELEEKQEAAMQPPVPADPALDRAAIG
jgi:hypothetical protein